MQRRYIKNKRKKETLYTKNYSYIILLLNVCGECIYLINLIIKHEEKTDKI